mmetsp:Transcript_34523/g.103163  ORF Transcript_34523/g.103163 Transcript_34523/m.103163 type:complete len:209 (+) Transcript_34523:464-1090(+)
MALGLRDTNTSHLLVLNGAEGEGQRGKAAVDLGDELPCLLRLQVVARLHSSLVDCVPQLGLSTPALAGGHDDVNAVDLVHLKLKLINLLLRGLAGNDDPVAIHDVLLQLVGEHALHWLAIELRGHLGKGLRHSGVGLPHLHQSHSCLGSVPSCHDDVRAFVLHGVAANHDSVGCRGNETVDVASHVHLGNIPSLQLSRFTLHWGEVPN